MSLAGTVLVLHRVLANPLVLGVHANPDLALAVRDGLEFLTAMPGYWASNFIFEILEHAVGDVGTLGRTVIPPVILPSPPPLLSSRSRRNCPSSRRSGRLEVSELDHQCLFQLFPRTQATLSASP